MSANLMKQPDEAAWSWLLQMKSSVDLKLRLLFKLGFKIHLPLWKKFIMVKISLWESNIIFIIPFSVAKITSSFVSTMATLTFFSFCTFAWMLLANRSDNFEMTREILSENDPSLAHALALSSKFLKSLQPTLLLSSDLKSFLASLTYWSDIKIILWTPKFGALT